MKEKGLAEVVFITIIIVRFSLVQSDWPAKINYKIAVWVVFVAGNHASACILILINLLQLVGRCLAKNDFINKLVAIGMGGSSMTHHTVG